MRKIELSRRWKGELVYAFKDVSVTCSLDLGEYNEQDRLDADAIIRSLSKEILIDKTYVDFEGTRFEKTFLTESGWDALRDLVVDTDFGRKCTARQRLMLDNTYRQMLPGYFEMVFEDFGWDVDAMTFEVSDGVPLNVEILPDTADEWRTYPGKWQTWT